MNKALILHQSNRLEALADLASDLIMDSKNEGSPFESTTVLINNFEMAQWFSIRFSERHGICANIDFRLVGSFFWEISKRFLGENISREVITQEELEWSVFKELLDLTNRSEPEEGLIGLKELLGDRDKRDFFPLASEIARVFDGYLNYRFDILAKWEKGKDLDKYGWQAYIWKRISTKKGARFRTDYLRRLLTALYNETNLNLTLPRDLFVFGISYLSPLHLDILGGLSRFTKVQLFVFNPCKEYWLDLAPEKERAFFKRIKDWKGISHLYLRGHKLLSSLGQSGKAFWERLLSKGFEIDSFKSKEIFISPKEMPSQKATSLLEMLQEDILLNRLRDGDKGVIEDKDRSILINSCYSPLREVEALHDFFVHIFNSDLSLNPRDCLVLCPDLKKYRPYIEAVFGSTPKERFIPFSIGDRSFEEDDPVARAYLRIISFPFKHFNSQEVYDLLSLKPVMEHLEIDEGDISNIREWIADSNIRTGFNTISRGLDIRENTWLFGIDRMFASWCMEGKGDEILKETGIYPLECPIEGSEVRSLAILSSFVHGLQEIVCSPKELKIGLSPEQWREWFLLVMKTFLSKEPAQDEKVKDLYATLLDIVKKMKDEGIEALGFNEMFSVVKRSLCRAFPHGSQITGKVLFSNFIPMRTIPYKVICLLGMNDEDFPRKVRFPSFDLIARDLRPGDRNPRDEDRYLFLETICAARKMLWISFTGKNERDNTEKNPSSVVQELLDYLEDSFKRTDGDSIRPLIFVEHPLQPFSSRYRDTDEKWLPPTYAKEWHAQKIFKDKDAHLLKLCHGPLPLTDEEMKLYSKVSVDDFAWFFSHPVRHFLRKRLGIDLDIGKTLLEITEPQRPDPKVNEIIMEGFKEPLSEKINDFPQKVSTKEILLFWEYAFRRSRAMGLLPPGNQAKIHWEYHLLNGVNLPKLIKALKKYGLSKDVLDIKEMIKVKDGEGELFIDLEGALRNLKNDGGLLEFSHRKLTDSYLSVFWIKHIIISRIFNEDSDGKISIIVSPKSKEVRLRILEDDISNKIFKEFFITYLEGLRRPLYFLPRFSKKIAEKLHNRDDSPVSLSDIEEIMPLLYEDEKCNEAINAILKNEEFRKRNGKYWATDRWLEYAFKGLHKYDGLMAFLKEIEFIELSLKFFLPLLHAKS